MVGEGCTIHSEELSVISLVPLQMKDELWYIGIVSVKNEITITGMGDFFLERKLPFQLCITKKPVIITDADRSQTTKHTTFSGAAPSAQGSPYYYSLRVFCDPELSHRVLKLLKEPGSHQAETQTCLVNLHFTKHLSP